MKNSKIFVLAAMALALSSCFGVGPSTSEYILRGSFDYAASPENQEYFKDSVFMAKKIFMDEISYVASTYEDEYFGGGFLLSTRKDSLSVSPYASANRGAGAGDSDVYAVYVQGPMVPKYGWRIDFTGYTNCTCEVSGFYVNNTSEALNAVKNSANDGDYIKVTVQGFLNDTPGKTAAKYLMDYTGGKKDFITQWTAFELKDFGLVDALSFNVETNRRDITPAFCMDSFIAKVHLEY